MLHSFNINIRLCFVHFSRACDFVTSCLPKKFIKLYIFLGTFLFLWYEWNYTKKSTKSILTSILLYCISIEKKYCWCDASFLWFTSAHLFFAVPIYICLSISNIKKSKERIWKQNFCKFRLHPTLRKNTHSQIFTDLNKNFLLAYWHSPQIVLGLWNQGCIKN